jgi:hypothetical protein
MFLTVGKALVWRNRPVDRDCGSRKLPRFLNGKEGGRPARRGGAQAAKRWSEVGVAGDMRESGRGVDLGKAGNDAGQVGVFPIMAMAARIAIARDERMDADCGCSRKPIGP